MAPPPDLDPTAELRLVPDFRDLPPETLAELAAATSQRRVASGSHLVEQGVVSSVLAILVRGAAKLVRAEGRGGAELGPPKDEDLVVLDVLRAPAVITDPSLVDGSPASFGVITLRASHVLLVDGRVLSRLAVAHPSLQRALLVRFAQELRAQVRRIDEITLGSAEQRVQRLLDSLSERHGTPLGQGRFIAIPRRRRDIACMVNATTETVSRLLARLERDGALRSTRDGLWWRARGVQAAAPPPSSASLSQQGDDRSGA